MKKEEMKKREKQIKKLRKEGLVQKKIAEKLGISEVTVRHYLRPELRKNMYDKRKELISKNIKEHRKYHRDYQRERYHEDEDFRRMKLDASGKWEKENKEEVNKYRKERYWRLKGDSNV